jgi:hypothetical protein
MIDHSEIEEDCGKVRRRKIIYLAAGLGMFALGSVLFVLFIFQRSVPEMLLGAVAFIWGAILVNQALRCRDIEDNINVRLERMAAGEESPEEGASVPGGADSPPSGSSGGVESEKPVEEPRDEP